MGLDMIVFCITTILIGYLVSFHGLQIKNFLIVIVWFLIGFTVSNNIFENTFPQIDMLHAFSTIIGLLCSLLSYKLERISVFISVAWMVGITLYSKLTFDTNINLIISILLGLIAGLLSLKFMNILVIIATALIGSSIMIKGFNMIPLNIETTILIIIQIFIIIFGIIYQLRVLKRQN